MFAQPFAAPYAPGYADTFVGAGADPAPALNPLLYDYTETNPDDGRFYITAQNFSYVFPLTVDDGGNGPRGDFTQLAGLSYPAVPIAKGTVVTSAILTLHYNAGDATQLQVFGVSNATIATSTGWTNTVDDILDFYAHETVGVTFPTVFDASDMDVDVTDIVNEILSSTNWVSGNAIRFWVEPVDASPATYQLTTGDPRLVIRLDPYVGHTMVVFDGVNDWLYYSNSENDPALVDGRYVTIAFKITPRKVAGTSQVILGMGGSTQSMTIYTGNQLRLQWNTATFGGLRMSNYTTPLVMDTDTSYIVHMAFDCSATPGPRVMNLWANGQPVAVAPIFSGASDVATFTHAAILGTTVGSQTYTGSSPLQADMGFFWMTVGDTTAEYITDPTKFCTAGGADVDLGSDGSLAGIQPIIFFGGSHTAADWNTGTNYGTGGATYTMNPDGVT